jgi:hypothetical protein
MRSISRIGIFIMLLGTSMGAFANSWTYKVNSAPGKDYETMCTDPSGNSVGGWRSCYVDSNCNHGDQIARRCEMRYAEPKTGWEYAVNPKDDHETKCIKPNGDFVGGFRRCDNDKTCNNAEAIRDVCRITYGPK